MALVQYPQITGDGLGTAPRPPLRWGGLVGGSEDSLQFGTVLNREEPHATTSTAERLWGRCVVSIDLGHERVEQSARVSVCEMRVSSTAREDSEVDLSNAIQKHAEWKFKFRAALQNNELMDAATISTDNNCEFGKWLHGEAKAQFGNDDSYAKCVAAHAAFHVEAGKIAAAINAKKQEAAQRLMAVESQFAEVSKKVGVSTHTTDRPPPLT